MARKIVVGAGVAAMCVLSLGDEITSPRAGQQAAGAASRKPRGDVIMLKSGKRLDEVQVYAESVRGYVVEIIEGVRVTIPRGQVVSIEYDDFEPRPAQPLGSAAASMPGEIRGLRLSRQVNARMNKPLGAPPLSYKDGDLLVILDDLSKRTGVRIIADPTLSEIPLEERRWSMDIPPDMTLFRWLREDLLNRFPHLEVEYKYDRIVVSYPRNTKAAGSGEAGG